MILLSLSKLQLSLYIKSLSSLHRHTNSIASSTKVDRDFYIIPEIPISDKLEALIVKRIHSYHKYLEHVTISDRSKTIFQQAIDFVDQFYNQHQSTSNDDVASNKDNNVLKRVILDSGCGRGRSTIALAKQYPHLPVIGIDRSTARLVTNKHYTNINPISVTSNNINQYINTDDRDEDAYDDIDTGDDEDDMDNDIQSLHNILLLNMDLRAFWTLSCMQSDWIIDQHYLLHPNPYPKPRWLSNRLYGEKYNI
jgi:tRNA G46 methylase TrmB